MKTVNCIVQDGQVDEPTVARLEEGLSGVVATFFEEEIEVNWTSVAKGSGFTGGVPSSSSLVSLSVLADIKQERRVELLDAICTMWSGVAGCHVNEVVATAVNASWE